MIHALLFVLAILVAILLVIVTFAIVFARAVDRLLWDITLPASAQDIIILYDGECGLCDSSVQFVLKHDRTSAIRFAPLQSQPGRELAGNSSQSTNLSTVVLWINGRLFRRSDAALIILRQIGLPWSLAGSVLALIPTRLRDAAYNYVAAHRHAWFPFHGASCRLGTSEDKARFLA
jgi:predicted DCC family thiol-disulfide oxidoreductase YuxK